MMDDLSPWVAWLVRKFRLGLTGADLNSTAWAGTGDITNAGGAEATGSATTIPRGDHRHAMDFGSPSALTGSAADGTGTSAARNDHLHAWTWATTSEIADVADTEAAGSGTTVPRGDHVHGKAITPRALFHLTASQSLANGTEAAISWPSGGADVNVGPMWASGNPTRFTVPSGQGGLYDITGQVVYAASAAGTRRLAEIWVNGAAYLNYYVDLPSRGAGLDTQVEISRKAVFAAGDYIELRGFQDTGGALNALSTSNGTYLGMVRVG